jgi:hypothetical protein
VGLIDGGGVLRDKTRASLNDNDHRGLQVRVRNTRENTGVGDAQATDTMNVEPHTDDCSTSGTQAPRRHLIKRARAAFARRELKGPQWVALALDLLREKLESGAHCRHVCRMTQRVHGCKPVAHGVRADDFDRER